jgi:transposase
VSTDGGVPLVSHTYAGDRPDVTQFPVLVQELLSRFENLLGEGKNGRGEDQLTLVYDASQNSKDNYELLRGAPLHFVGLLPPSDHP